MKITDNYIRQLEDVIKQMIKPLKNIPFNLVIEALSGKKVIPFDFFDKDDKALLELLKEVAELAGKKINQNGIIRKRANEVGNDIEEFVKEALNEKNLKAETPISKKGHKKSTGYPDILFWYKGKPYYLECKTFNIQNIDTTQRSFYFSPSDDFKVIYDTHHFLLSYEMVVVGRKDDKNIFKTKHWKLLSIENLSVDVKYEFNSDNRRLYSNKDGAKILAQGDIEI